MIRLLTRRSLAAAAIGAALSAPARAAPGALAALEASSGARLGVAALDTGSRRRIAHRAGERFPMLSTHKFLTAASILAQVDAHRVALGERIPYGPADLLDYAPVARRNVGAGFMTIEALCEAALQWSDNTAANLLLARIGGPPGWTRYARSIGDNISRLDRTEPALNTAIPGDPRDTTTPDAMLADVGHVLEGTALSEASRSRLRDWMLGGRVTGTLLRAGVPAGWRVADKSGSGERGSRNDIGMILPPGAAPILACIFTMHSPGPPETRDAVIAEATRIIVRAFRS